MGVAVSYERGTPAAQGRGVRNAGAPGAADARSPSSPGSTGMLPLLKTLSPDPLD